MTIETRQLYPSTENFQHTNADTIAFNAAAAMLDKMISKLPPAQRLTVRISGWKAFRLVYDYELTADEVRSQRLDEVRGVLNLATRDGLTAAEVKELLAKLSGI